MPVNSKAPQPVDGWLSAIGRIVLPPRCLVCGDVGADGHDLCRACQQALPWNVSACAQCGLPMPVLSPIEGPVQIAVEGPVLSNVEASQPVVICGRCLKKPPPIDRVHAAFRYGFPVDRLLPRFKFHHDLAAGRELSAAMQAMLFAARMDQSTRDDTRSANDAAPIFPQALIPIPLHIARLRQRGYNQALELARPLATAFGLPLLHDGLRRIRDIAPQSELGALARRRNPRGAFAVGRDALPTHVALVDDVMTTGATLYECARVLKRAGVQHVDAWVAARVPRG